MDYFTDCKQRSASVYLASSHVVMAKKIQTKSSSPTSKKSPIWFESSSEKNCEIGHQNYILNPFNTDSRTKLFFLPECRITPPHFSIIHYLMQCNVNHSKNPRRRQTEHSCTKGLITEYTPRVFKGVMSEKRMRFVSLVLYI